MVVMVLLWGSLPVTILSDSIFQDRGYSLYNSKRNPKIGDIITVLISAESTAISQAGTKTSKRSAFGADLYGVNDQYRGSSAGSESKRDLYNYKLQGKDDYSGVGQTTRKSKVETVVSATIIDIKENGNLEIVGEYSIKINDELEKIRISGIVRPEDIGQDNTVPSNKIANGKVSVKGDGVVSSKQSPGVVSRLFGWIF